MADSTISTNERRTGWRTLVIAVPLALLSVAPLAWALISALRPSSEIFSHLSPFTLATVLPTDATLQNFEALLQGTFLNAMLNSVVVAFVGVALGLVVSSLAAYALAVLRFPGRDVVFTFMVLSFLIPFEAIAIPLAVTFRNVGLENTFTGLILPALGNGLAIFLLRQFFLNIPFSLSEAARLDGANWFGVFWRIYLPLSRGGLLGAGILLFVFQWQAFLWPLLIAPSPEKQVAPVAIANLSQQSGVDYGQMFAAVVLISALPLVLLLIFQRQFTGSLASTGSKE